MSGCVFGLSMYTRFYGARVQLDLQPREPLFSVVATKVERHGFYNILIYTDTDGFGFYI